MNREARFEKIPLPKIVTPPKKEWLRKYDDQDELDQLVASIKAEGQKIPIIVRKTLGDNYEVICGLQRLWALGAANKKHALCMVYDKLPDEEAHKLIMLENFPRSEVDPISKARYFQYIMKENGHSESDIAKMLGCDKTNISQYLRLLTLPRDIQDMVGMKELSWAHAKQLLRLDNVTMQRYLAEKTVELGWSAKKLAVEVTNVLEARTPKDRGVELVQPPCREEKHEPPQPSPRLREGMNGKDIEEAFSVSKGKSEFSTVRCSSVENPPMGCLCFRCPLYSSQGSDRNKKETQAGVNPRVDQAEDPDSLKKEG